MYYLKLKCEIGDFVNYICIIYVDFDMNKLLNAFLFKIVKV